MADSRDQRKVKVHPFQRGAKKVADATSPGTFTARFRMGDGGGDLWDAYKAACEAMGTDRAADLRSHIQRVVDKHAKARRNQDALFTTGGDPAQ
jgi:hypothetical protein